MRDPSKKVDDLVVLGESQSLSSCKFFVRKGHVGRSWDDADFHWPFLICISMIPINKNYLDKPVLLYKGLSRFVSIDFLSPAY